jgi:hypothetical protein
MPDLSELNSKLSLQFALNRVFGGGGPSDPRSYALAVNFVRIVDIALLSYEQIRLELTTFVNGPGNLISPLLIATGKCESLLECLQRAIRLARRIKSDKNGPSIDRYLGVLTGTTGTCIGHMRDAIQHVDEKLMGKEWRPGDPSWLLMENDRISLMGQEILYSEVAAWLRELHRVATKIAAPEVETARRQQVHKS